MIYMESMNNTEIVLFYKIKKIERKTLICLVEIVQACLKYLFEEAYEQIFLGRAYKLR